MEFVATDIVGYDFEKRAERQKSDSVRIEKSLGVSETTGSSATTP